MNKANKNTFLTIKSAAATFQTDVAKSFESYIAEVERAKERAKAYKDEQNVFDNLRGNAAVIAQNSIKAAADNFSKTIAESIVPLKKELAEHIANRPNQAFIDSLRTFRDFSIKLTKGDIEALIALNSGNPLGLRALDATIESTHSPFKLNYAGIEAFENDLSLLGKMADSVTLWTPSEYHVDACDIFGGEPMWGTSDGRTYNSISLITSRASFESVVNGLEDMEKRWTTSVTPSVEQLEKYASKEEFEDDVKSTAKSAEILNDTDNDVSVGRETGAKSAEDAKNYATVMDYYK